PRPTPRHEAAHSCGNGHLGCCNPRHLRWASHVANMADKVEHGTHQIGEKHGMARLTENDVRYIRKMRGKVSQQKVAAQFGVTFSAISCVQRRATWRHIP